MTASNEEYKRQGELHPDYPESEEEWNEAMQTITATQNKGR